MEKEASLAAFQSSSRTIIYAKATKTEKTRAFSVRVSGRRHNSNHMNCLLMRSNVSGQWQ